MSPLFPRLSAFVHNFAVQKFLLIIERKKQVWRIRLSLVVLKSSGSKANNVYFRMQVFCFSFKYFNNMNIEVGRFYPFKVIKQTFANLYTNLFDYPLYIGICLLLMLVYPLIYFLLVIYVEQLNPGEFGIFQPWIIFSKNPIGHQHQYTPRIQVFEQKSISMVFQYQVLIVGMTIHKSVDVCSFSMMVP